MNPGARLPAGQLRCGRLLATASGLVDLPTGLPARLSVDALGAVDPQRWRPVTCWSEDDVAAATGVGQCVDAWLTSNWLGRWVVRTVVVDMPRPARAGPRPPEVPPGTWRGSSLLVARAPRLADWLALAAASRREGVVPVRLALVPWLTACEALSCPPLVVAVAPSETSGGAALLESWLQRGGRVHAVVLVPTWRWLLDGCDATRRPSARGPVVPGVSLLIRALRRAWRALPSAPALPASRRMPCHPRPPGFGGSDCPGDRWSMTHQELLDVTTQLDDVRHDGEAMSLACRVARAHLRAAHTALVAADGGEPRVVACDGPAADSPLAWRELCRPDAPRALASVAGWHVAAAHATEQGTVWMCGRWTGREEGERAADLLAVFARLIASRVRYSEPSTRGGAGLEQTLVGHSRVMQDVRAQIALAARAPFPVLIRGESGCGKELAARAIHALGVRRHRRLAAINCAALPDDLIESELFGHVRGAFTGATTDRGGLFDDADGGTLFLDEVGELGPRAQAKLLRVLQDGEVRRVGENQARRVDVRVVAATNVSLEDAVRHGRFRADLFYRLDVVRVRMPALRERRDDVAHLSRHFWQDCTARLGSRARLDDRVLEALARYDWPGNVRQLQNTLAAMAVRVPSRGRVSVDDLPPEIRAQQSATSYALAGGLEAARREFEVSFVREVLTRSGGRSATAARDLGVTRQGLSKLVRRLGLDDEDAAAGRLP